MADVGTTCRTRGGREQPSPTTCPQADSRCEGEGVTVFGRWCAGTRAFFLRCSCAGSSNGSSSSTVFFHMGTISSTWSTVFSTWSTVVSTWSTVVSTRDDPATNRHPRRTDMENGARTTPRTGVVLTDSTLHVRIALADTTLHVDIDIHLGRPPGPPHIRGDPHAERLCGSILNWSEVYLELEVRIGFRHAATLRGLFISPRTRTKSALTTREF